MKKKKKKLTQKFGFYFRESEGDLVVAKTLAEAVGSGVMFYLCPEEFERITGLSYEHDTNQVWCVKATFEIERVE